MQSVSELTVGTVFKTLLTIQNTEKGGNPYIRQGSLGEILGYENNAVVVVFPGQCEKFLLHGDFLVKRLTPLDIIQFRLKNDKSHSRCIPWK